MASDAPVLDGNASRSGGFPVSGSPVSGSPSSGYSVSLTASSQEEGRRKALDLLGRDFAMATSAIEAESFQQGRYMGFFRSPASGAVPGAPVTGPATPDLGGTTPSDPQDDTPWPLPAYALMIAVDGHFHWMPHPGNPVTSPFTVVPTGGDTEDHRLVRSADFQSALQGEISDGIVALLKKYRTDTLIVLHDDSLVVVHGDDLTDPLPCPSAGTPNRVAEVARTVYPLFTSAGAHPG
ncbi:hypothetical protein AD929_13200 [Gluconobacter potus]|uniref:Uncharacterized protein n=2 Tax=Gluconobacter potus TaxID=2724927 RepID=A0A149QS72_9PROT|nr:hypothetical protein AD929_13200 [Gluconobacter potus]